MHKATYVDVLFIVFGGQCLFNGYSWSSSRIKISLVDRVLDRVNRERCLHLDVSGRGSVVHIEGLFLSGSQRANRLTSLPLVR